MQVLRHLSDKLSVARNFLLNNKILFLVWFGVLFAILFSSNISLSKKIIGYVDNQKININFKEQVRVKRILTSSGSKVEKGDVIAILDDKDLDLLLRRKKQELEAVNMEMEALKEIDFFDSSNTRLKTALVKNQKLLKDEIKNLSEQIENHIVTAPYDCVISDIFFEEGEAVPAMSPLFAIQTETTNLVHAFINEHDNFPLKNGQKVLVKNIHSTMESKGKIIAMSNEYKEMPVRIATTELTTSWGTRITIKLDEALFRRGEKVLIKSLNENMSPPFFINDARAEKSAQEKEALLLQAPVEFSAIQRLKDSLFLVANDEGKSLVDGIFIFDEKTNGLRSGKFENDVQIEDVESIAEIGNGEFLVAGSQSLTKKGKSGQPRFKAIHIRWKQGREFEVLKEIDLREKMLEFLVSAFPEEKGRLEEELDVEAAQVFKDEIYFGLKSPKVARKALFVAHDVKSFLTKGFNPEIARLVKSNLPNINYQVSDLKIVAQDEVYASFVKDGKSSLYRTSLDFKDFESVYSDAAKIEGVEKLSDQSFILAIDQGKKGGRIKKVGISK